MKITMEAEDYKPHCGFTFPGGMKCRASEAHPVHHPLWTGQEPGHAFVAERHRFSQPRCVECGQPIPDAAMAD